jgi:hypothetical protein
MQFALGIYLAVAAVASGVGAQLLKQKEPFFIVLGLATMLYPNVLWYHHFVFFIVPVLLWLGYTHERPMLLAWVLSGMLIIQVDRWYLTRGLLIQAFGHLSMLIVVGGQMRDLVRRPVVRGTYAEEIP